LYVFFEGLSVQVSCIFFKSTLNRYMDCFFPAVIQGTLQNNMTCGRIWKAVHFPSLGPKVVGLLQLLHKNILSFFPVLMIVRTEKNPSTKWVTIMNHLFRKCMPDG
jgi:hypothetical protein